MNVDERWIKDLNSIFDHAIRRRGSRSIVLAKPLPKIDLFTSRKAERNAFAMKKNDGYEVGICFGLYNEILSIFQTTLADPRMFTYIGDSEAESPVKSVRKVQQKFFQDNASKIANRKPKDKKRNDFALYLTNLTMRFVLEHEIAHILLGHLDADEKVIFFEEGSDRELPQDENFGIEMHADEIAFAECFDWIADSVKGVDRELQNEFSNQSPERRVWDLLVATYVLFQTFSHLSMSNTHPSPLHRQLRIGMILEWWIETTSFPVKTPPRKLINMALDCVNFQFENILGVDWTDRRNETIEILDPNNGIEVLETYNNLIVALGDKYDAPDKRPHLWIILYSQMR